MRIGYHAITWGSVTGDASGVTSVKDLAYRVTGWMPQALREIAAAGYKGVEMFDGNVAELSALPDDDSESLPALLAETGLHLVAVHTSGNFIYPDLLDDELHRVRQAADLARRHGAEHLVVGGGARRTSCTTDADRDQLAKTLDLVDKLAAEQGLTARYHPHLGAIVEDPDDVEAIFAASRIGFRPDTAHLAAGGCDPAALIRRYGDRVHHVHLKDLRANTFLPLGSGEVDLPDVLRALDETGYDGLASRRARLLRWRPRRGRPHQPGPPRGRTHARGACMNMRVNLVGMTVRSA